MAKFLTTTGTSFYIEQIIIDSCNNLTLVTPYLKLSRNLIERLSDADKQGVKITLIYGKSDLAAQEKRVLFLMKNIQIYYCENLHAKCYHNENSMIITSMNLYEFSEKNNREMGILVEKDKDEEIFNNAIKEIGSIKNASKLEKDFERPIDKDPPQESINQKTSSSGLPIEMDPNYTEHGNFYMPYLKMLLKEKYPDREINLGQYLSISGFPAKGVDLEVDYRITFRFSDEINYSQVKANNRGRWDEDLIGVRFFWNYNQVNIYPEKSFTASLDKDGMIKYAARYQEIIESVFNKLKLYYQWPKPKVRV